MTDFNMAYAGICRRRATSADQTAKLLYAIRQVADVAERELDSVADELKESAERGRQCQIGRDELERENRALRNRLAVIDDNYSNVIDRLTSALRAIPESDDEILDIENARTHIENVIKILAPPTHTNPTPF